MLQAKSISVVFDKWDNAIKSWKLAVESGQSNIVALANGATSMGHLTSSSVINIAGSNIVSSAATIIYQKLVEKHQKLLQDFENLILAVHEMEACIDGDGTADSLSSNNTLLLTHDGPSLRLLLLEICDMYKSQLQVCEDVVSHMHPDTVRASTSTALTLYAAMWMMEPMIEPTQLTALDRIKRSELDQMARSSFLG